MSIAADRISEHISYHEFYLKYLVGNRPCILSSKFTGKWPCRLKWIDPTSLKLDINIFRNLYGEELVPVYNCGSDMDYGNSRVCSEKMNSYLHRFQSSENSDQYLKDWHFQREHPGHQAYDVPEYFTSDWLNEYCDEESAKLTSRDDYRFLYLGPAGSWTPLHEDVLQSFSWSANICGAKKWILFPPGSEIRLEANNKLISDVSDRDLERIPHAVIHQKAGEIVFVPSRWHHQVWNLEETLSINHNWINAACMRNLWELLLSTLAKVEKEICDCRDTFSASEWERQCQVILKADLGMNLEEFADMLSTIGRNRLQNPQNDFVLKVDLNALLELTNKYVERFPDSLQCEKLKNLHNDLTDLTIKLYGSELTERNETECPSVID